MYTQWEENSKNPQAVQLRDIPDLIHVMGRFDHTYEDSPYNLSRMIQMQDATAERDERYGKTEKRNVYGGGGEFWRRIDCQMAPPSTVRCFPTHRLA